MCPPFVTGNGLPDSCLRQCLPLVASHSFPGSSQSSLGGLPFSSKLCLHLATPDDRPSLSPAAPSPSLSHGPYPARLTPCSSRENSSMYSLPFPVRLLRFYKINFISTENKRVGFHLQTRSSFLTEIFIFRKREYYTINLPHKRDFLYLP